VDKYKQMKIFKAKTIQEIDKYTIDNEPILSIDLMERAALKLFMEIKNKYAGKQFLILAGPGNNGGDALALSRMLLRDGFDITTLLLREKDLSSDTEINRKRLYKIKKAKIQIWEENEQLPYLNSNSMIIDGLFGTGLNRPITGSALKLIQKVNRTFTDIISIDIPSGLMCENNYNNNPEGIIKADFVYTFQYPKLAFLFPENQEYVSKWEILDIGLLDENPFNEDTKWHLTELQDINCKLNEREKFNHKGMFGHALLIAGSYGKTGAAILAAKACLRSGAGLLTVHTPQKGYEIMQISVPEAMVNIDNSELIFSEFPDLNNYSAIGIGPGIGTQENTVKAFADLLKKINDKRLVIDADAINILSQNQDLIDKLPNRTILTPHPKEFERLVGKWSDDYHRLEMAIDFCIKKDVILVLKGAYTTVILPDGTTHFNSTGNPGMATAGSGDVLTGIILGMLARGLTPENAAIAGVYLHGLAGDLAKESFGEESMIASDIISFLGKAYKRILGMQN